MNDPKWYAVATMPRHEKTAHAQLERLGVRAFLPTYSSTRVWKNRQRQTIIAPLFPTYMFVHITHAERSKVLGTPGVRQIVGTSREPLPVDEGDLEALRRTVEGCAIGLFTAC